MLIHNFYSVKMQFESQLELQKHLWTTKELTAVNITVSDYLYHSDLEHFHVQTDTKSQ